MGVAAILCLAKYEAEQTPHVLGKEILLNYSVECVLTEFHQISCYKCTVRLIMNLLAVDQKFGVEE